MCVGVGVGVWVYAFNVCHVVILPAGCVFVIVATRCLSNACCACLCSFSGQCPCSNVYCSTRSSNKVVCVVSMV